MRRKTQNGFTLIELSIVLVIIGLLVGGVLVGRDLIQAAQVRAQIAQIEKFSTAVNTFQLKYDCLPGDCANAAAYGFTARGEIAQGDGNGLLEANNGGFAFSMYQSKGETALFWRDLSEAKLVEGAFTTATIDDPTIAGGVNLSGTSTPNLDAFFPRAKISGNNWVVVYSLESTNYYAIIGNPSIQPNGPSFTHAGIPVILAYAIDSKIDDGGPQSGGIIARGMFWNTVVNWAVGTNSDWVTAGADPGTAFPASTYACYDNGNNAAAPMRYTLDQGSGANLNCSLSFGF